jgi:hypothetical protein
MNAKKNPSVTFVPQIAINGQHFAEFRSRTPMERVSYLSADGEIMIAKINFEGGSHGMPGMHAPMPAPMPMPMPGMPQQHYPAPGMPHQPYPAPGGMYPTQPGMGYPTQPGMGYPTQPGMGYSTQPGMHPANYGHLSPKSAVSYETLILTISFVNHIFKPFTIMF